MARILIIDDSAVMRSLLKDFLTDAGHDVETASDGDVGLRMALESDYDVCICDMHMPKLNGYDVLTHITPDKPDLHLVFTDSLPDHLSEKVRQAGDYHSLRKPFELDQLREILDGLLRPVRR